VALFTLAAVLGRDAGIQLNLIVGAAAPFVILGLKRPALIGAVVILCFGLHIAAWFLFPPEKALIAVEPDLMSQLYVSSAVTAFGVTAALFYYAFHLAEAAEAETEALLRNMLPDSVVERLKAQSGDPVAESYSEASVLFADLKGFVPLSRRLGAERTVSMLNDLVRGFDRLAAQHGVEKNQDHWGLLHGGRRTARADARPCGAARPVCAGHAGRGRGDSAAVWGRPALADWAGVGAGHGGRDRGSEVHLRRVGGRSERCIAPGGDRRAGTHPCLRRDP
jgi:class 3 adenylate cyclase